jgi:hypothetical protein
MSDIKINLLLLHSVWAPPYWITPQTRTLQEQKAQTIKTHSRGLCDIPSPTVKNNCYNYQRSDNHYSLHTVKRSTVKKQNTYL